MVLKQKYLSQESAIANYNYEDIASGEGIVVFYGASVEDDTAEKHILTTQPIYSNNMGTAYATSHDLDFDIVFNKPQRIRGNLLCTFNMAAGANSNAYAIVKVRKLPVGGADPADEEEIASTQSGTKTILANNDMTWAVKVPITSIQHFKKGDTLRITMDVTASVNAIFHHDPTNRQGDYGFAIETSQLIFHVPFVVDV